MSVGQYMRNVVLLKRCQPIITLLLICNCARPSPTMALAAEIVRHTPEYVHFEPGTRFRWVWVKLKEGDADFDLTKAVLSLLRQRYAVYLRQEEIPAGQIVMEDDLPFYQDGFSFEFRVTHVNSTTVQIEYRDYEGPTGSALQTIVYEWSGYDWVIKEKSGILVSDSDPISATSHSIA